MTVEELEHFFSSQGTAAEVRADDKNVVADFKHRDIPYRATYFGSGTNLFEIACWYGAPKAERDRLGGAIAKALEQYPIVRFRQIDDTERAVFVVFADQIEPQAEHLTDFFWSLLDLVTAAGDFCYGQLESPSDAPPPDTDKAAAFEANLEKILAAGVDADDVERTGDAAAKRSIAATVISSLALIADADSTATAFCFHSDDKESLYLTCAHAVGDRPEVTLYRQWPSFEKHKAAVRSKGGSDREDFAVLAVEAPSLAYLALSPTPPDEGTTVALAGYPRVQFDIAATYGELIPSFHQGTVSALIDRGAIVLHDALSRPGNSGGPLFDPLTGSVLGIVQGGWENDGENVAIGVAKTVLPFLAKT